MCAVGGCDLPRHVTCGGLGRCQQVKKLLGVVVSNGLVMTSDELQSWEEDAEEYEIEDVRQGPLCALLALPTHDLLVCVGVVV